MLADRRVKIVATIGPSTASEEHLEMAVKAGMNVARLNFSHGSHEEHLNIIQSLRKLAQNLNAPISILQDLQGPKIRVGKFQNGSIELSPHDSVTITTRTGLGHQHLIPTDFVVLPQVVKKGTKILLDDGLIELKVEDIQGTEILCRVIYGGVLKDRKGMSVPCESLPIESLTSKDLTDLEFGLSNDVDYVALSFVRTAKDIRKLREIIESRGARAKIVAKIEMAEALENLEDIIRLSDAVMVARGDLAVEVGQAQLPRLQKEIIHLANELSKPVITATQMLDSMVENPRPTRAEITDVANAVLDGSDALMLSAESASGKHPFKCIRTMHEIISEVEKTTSNYYRISLDSEYLNPSGAIAASACLCALKLNAKAIICLTNSGQTATIISTFRPKAKIIAATSKITTLNSLELVWGIQTILVPHYNSRDEAMKEIEKVLLEYGVLKTGDKVVLTMGLPVVDGVQTNSLRVYSVGGEKISVLRDELLPLRCQEELEIY